MKYAKYILLFIILNFTVGCEDYLEEEAQSNISLQYIYDSPEGIESGVVGLYNLFRYHYRGWTSEGSSHLWPYVQNDLVMPRSGYIAVIAKFDKSAMRPDQYGAGLSAEIWRQHYKMIDRANALIEAGAELTEVDTTLNKTLAEARLFRANSLFTLYRLYNNVYVKTESTTPDNVFDRVSKPSTKEEIFAALHEDFDFAIEYLPWTDVIGRVNKGMAHHLKAKAALWEEDWATSLENAEALINSGYYMLEPDLKKIFGHPDVDFSYGSRNSSEALFVVQNEEGSTGGGEWSFLNTHFLTNYNRVVGAKYSYDQGGRGFGFVYPNQYLINLYESFDKRLDAYYKTKFYYNDEENLPEGVELGDQIIIPNSGSDQALYYERISPSCIKYFDSNIPPEAALSWNNILIYRLSETYIVAAEAAMRLGKGGKAQSYLQTLTDRAGVPPTFSVTEIDIMKEHARELAFEGHRFYFLKRIGKLVSQVRSFSGDPDYGNEARGNIKAHYVNLPIPQSELELLGIGYPQNDGY